MSAGAVRRALFVLLRRIEDDALTGVLDVSDTRARPLGRVMAAHGRLCFVAPADAAAPAGTDPDDEDVRRRLDEAAREARRRGTRLSAVLLEGAGGDLATLRAGLRRHAAQGLLSMARAAGDACWRTEFTPARADFDAGLTFSALDVFTACSALLDSAPADFAQRLFHEYAGEADAALLLLLRPGESGGLPLPLAVRGLEHASLRDVAGIGRSALSMLHPEALAHADAGARVASYQGAGGVWVGASGTLRLALLRTGPSFEAGQMLGLALRLARQV